MYLKKSLFLPLLFAGVLLSVGTAEARSYDCAVQGSAPEGSWEPTQAQYLQFVADWNSHSEWKDFLPRTCGAIEGGQQVLMTGALHIVGDDALCDDDANFAVFYDPRKRAFSDVIPHQKLCGHGQKIHRPGT